jgi:hypothetical protein
MDFVNIKDADLNSIRTKTPPKRDIPLLGPGEPWIMNACLNFQADMTIGYVEGYRKAAERLIDCVEEAQRDQDYLVYPILFLYRHHLELRLKELLDLQKNLGIRDHSAAHMHKLSQLWKECELGLKRIEGAIGEEDWYLSVTHCIGQIEAIDPASDAFRYSKRRDGSKSASTLKQVNLATLRITMESILDWLDGASIALRHHQSNLDGESSCS